MPPTTIFCFFISGLRFERTDLRGRNKRRETQSVQERRGRRLSAWNADGGTGCRQPIRGGGVESNDNMPELPRPARRQPARDIPETERTAGGLHRRATEKLYRAQPIRSARRRP